MDSHFDLPLPWFGHQVHIHNLFFDPTGWDANNRFSEADINAATSALVRSGYFDGLQQYGIPHPVFDGSVNSDAVCNPLASLGATGPLWTGLLKFMACEGATPFSGVVSTPGVPYPLTPATNIYNLFIPDRGVVEFPDGSRPAIEARRPGRAQRPGPIPDSRQDFRQARQEMVAKEPGHYDTLYRSLTDSGSSPLRQLTPPGD